MTHVFMSVCVCVCAMACHTVTWPGTMNLPAKAICRVLEVSVSQFVMSIHGSSSVVRLPATSLFELI
uniref:Putative secreted peptide n=1 Tax=Anopheles braziliensis TaxID=58242 RepID=A0A2M3ZWP7_9DIPT